MRENIAPSTPQLCLMRVYAQPWQRAVSMFDHWHWESARLAGFPQGRRAQAPLRTESSLGFFVFSQIGFGTVLYVRRGKLKSLRRSNPTASVQTARRPYLTPRNCQEFGGLKPFATRRSDSAPK